MINGVAHGPLPGTTVCQLTHASFQGWPGAVSGAVARQSVSGDQGSGGGPQRVRPHHRSGRLHQRSDRQRAGRQRDSGSERCADQRHGCGRLHRLRRVRGGLSECVGRAVHGRQDLAPRPAAARPAGAGSARACAWCGNESGGFRKLHQHRRMRGGVPEGDQAGSDRDE